MDWITNIARVKASQPNRHPKFMIRTWIKCWFFLRTIPRRLSRSLWEHLLCPLPILKSTHDTKKSHICSNHLCRWCILGPHDHIQGDPERENYNKGVSYLCTSLSLRMSEKCMDGRDFYDYVGGQDSHPQARHHCTRRNCVFDGT